MSSHALTSEAKLADEIYPLKRDQEETKRLNLQHDIIKKSFKFLIHPTILSSLVANADGHTIRIADFATGTAIWPIEVAQLFAENYPDVKVKVYGTDISSAQFPAGESVPHNVELKERDILKAFKERHFERYDFIHVRALVVVLGDDQWKEVLENLHKCLKPGGWIQWVDADFSRTGWKCISHKATDLPKIDPEHSLLSSQIPNPIQHGISLVQGWAEVLNRSLAASNNLPALFDAAGIQNIQHEIHQIDGDHELRTAITVELAKAASSIFQSLAKLLEGGEDAPPAEAVEQAGREMIACAEEGIFWTRIDFNVVIGQKAVYFTKTIILPQVLEDSLGEQKTGDDSVKLPEILVGLSIDGKDGKNSAGEVEEKLHEEKLGIVEPNQSAKPVEITASQVSVESAAEKPLNQKKEIDRKNVKSLPSEIDSRILSPQPKKPTMNAAAPPFQQSRLLPHEIARMSATPSPPHQRVGGNIPPRRFLPHERV
ncbi:S-adenosyl-L-methionine-dependent methyltransferase [Glarea lozoyensis ATCC 20868]|uniref:S-adenosyl-L-methionine-dependent methyltransferase n=1 Tax=Glarea lozoyensis (strain ATCC 20868 / MF5171) TaxID=1116229 RepID=S3EC59_GLAL2|nr:S-adenosyl-L-methionine-dependent methyltransferase [Glarea lozoyensis ATCC 20868]EPE35888.1 S-adenosyl-L-methionine-dependent methyltransferase [Glarea lozoyensis ATCC 20868]